MEEENSMRNLPQIAFGGGCHWCTEAVFQALKGVEKVEQGFACSHPPADSWSEAALVHFLPDQIDLKTLIEVHIRTHSATKNHSMRSKYRSAIYVFDDAQAQKSKNILSELNVDFENKLVTQVLRFVDFKPSDERYHEYYQSNPERAFCKRYIDPKLELIRSSFAKNVNENFL